MADLLSQHPDSSVGEDPEAALREARGRFIAAFPEQLTSASVLAGAAADPRKSKPLLHIVHQLAGLAGTVGFPTVSERAHDLEQLLSARDNLNVDASQVQTSLDQLIAAFDEDQRQTPEWAAVTAASHGVKVLIAEDDPAQQKVLAAWLAKAGYATVIAASGDQVVRLAEAERPSLILLDVDLPVVDGYQLFWEMKQSSELAAIPVIFMTARAGTDNRLTGLALGAGDYMEKPLEPRELLMRMDRLLNRAAFRPLAMVLPYQTFAVEAGELLQAGEAAVAMIRLPAQRQDDVVAALAGELRKRDLVGRYDRDHLVLAMPELDPVVACARLREAMGYLRTWAPAGLTAGIAVSSTIGERRVLQLVAEAQEALNEARHDNEAAAVKTERGQGPKGRRLTVILAEDDPQIVHIVAARMRAAGYQTVLAFDGQQALDAVRKHKADLLIIDLSMPKLSGFEVLERLRQSSPRPQTIVLSGHRASEDVRRASGLGASDYIVKPFDPDDLMTRVARLLTTAKLAVR